VETLLLLLVPVVLGALAHLSPEMSLQQYWAAVSNGTDSIVRSLGSCSIRMWQMLQMVCAVCRWGEQH
jgi:uncharacterized membrane protein